MCLNETHSTVRVGKHLSETFLIKNGFKQGDVLLLYFSTLLLQCAIRRVPVNQDSFKLNGTHQLLVFADINMLGRGVHLQRNTQKH